jgi:regulator of protease activity HflC (stomatin/prohibitin superfamily)
MNPQDPNMPSPNGAPPAEDAGTQALAEAIAQQFFIVQIIMVALVLVFLGSGFFTVGPQEAAILRLGKPVNGGQLLGPGPHWAWPKPIDEVIKIRITSLSTPILPSVGTSRRKSAPKERRSRRVSRSSIRPISPTR